MIRRPTSAHRVQTRRGLLSLTVVLLGGDAALARLRQRLRKRGLRLMLDFVPNHTGLDYQNKLARFLENHDQPRAAVAFPKGRDQAAAVITFLSPGLRFFHQGQFEGRLKRISPHLGRAPDEELNRPLKQFYERLIDVLRRPAVRQGQWQLLECVPAWNGNASSDAFIASAWQDSGGARLLVAANYASHPSQCYVRLPFPDLAGRTVPLKDMMGPAQYDRDGNDLASRGLYLDLPSWGYHVFALSHTSNTSVRDGATETKNDAHAMR